MKKLNIKSDFDKKTGIYSLNVTGEEFNLSFHSKDKKEFELRKSMAEDIREYYEK